MKPEYREGPEALENFKEGMKALFKVSKADLAKAEKRKKRNASRAESVRKPKSSDKD